MTKEEKEIDTRLYTYQELMYTFLAGGSMASEHHINWMDAFEKWVEHIEEARKNTKHKSN